MILLLVLLFLSARFRVHSFVDFFFNIFQIERLHSDLMLVPCVSAGGKLFLIQFPESYFASACNM